MGEAEGQSSGGRTRVTRLALPRTETKSPGVELGVKVGAAAYEMPLVRPKTQGEPQSTRVIGENLPTHLRPAAAGESTALLARLQYAKGLRTREQAGLPELTKEEEALIGKQREQAANIREHGAAAVTRPSDARGARVDEATVEFGQKMDAAQLEIRRGQREAGRPEDLATQQRLDEQTQEGWARVRAKLSPRERRLADEAQARAARFANTEAQPQKEKKAAPFYEMRVADEKGRPGAHLTLKGEGEYMDRNITVFLSEPPADRALIAIGRGEKGASDMQFFEVSGVSERKEVEGKKRELRGTVTLQPLTEKDFGLLQMGGGRQTYSTEPSAGTRNVPLTKDSLKALGIKPETRQDVERRLKTLETIIPH